MKTRDTVTSKPAVPGLVVHAAPELVSTGGSCRFVWGPVTASISYSLVLQNVTVTAESVALA